MRFALVAWGAGTAFGKPNIIVICASVIGASIPSASSDGDAAGPESSSTFSSPPSPASPSELADGTDAPITEAQMTALFGDNWDEDPLLYEKWKNSQVDGNATNQDGPATVIDDANDQAERGDAKSADDNSEGQEEEADADEQITADSENADENSQDAAGTSHFSKPLGLTLLKPPSGFS